MGLAQEHELNQDVSKWNQENFNHFQRILYKFIPLIRFYEISSEDYINKVKFYEKILLLCRLKRKSFTFEYEFSSTTEFTKILCIKRFYVEFQ